MSTIRRTVVAILGALSLACATTPPAADPAPSGDTTNPDVVQVTVVHGGGTGGNVTVYAEPTAGVRSAIGSLDPGDTKTFAYRVQDGNRRFRLVALNSTGQEIRSDVVTVARGAGVNWNIQINSIRVR